MGAELPASGACLQAQIHLAEGRNPVLEPVRRSIQNPPDLGGEGLEREGLGHKLDARIETSVMNNGVA